MQSAVLERFDNVIQTCRQMTYLTHQYRHLTKVRVADGKAKLSVRRTSAESMNAHISSYADLPEARVHPLFTQAVKDEITDFGG